MAEKQNRFEKAVNDRRSQFVEENDHVADSIMQSKVEENDKDEDESISLKDLFAKTKPRKRQCSYYLDSKVDDFFMRFAEVIDSSKSELINQLLTIAILENQDIQEMVNSNKKVAKMLKEFCE